MKNTILISTCFLVVFLFLFSSCEKEVLEIPEQAIESTQARKADETKLTPSQPDTLNAISLDASAREAIDQAQNRSSRVLIHSETGSVNLGNWRSFWYNKNNLPNPAEYKYEVEVTPLSGDPDLYFYGYNSFNGIWRYIRGSNGSGVDANSFRQSGLTSEETHAFVGVYGYTNATFQINIYRSTVNCQEYPAVDLCYITLEFPTPKACGCDGITYPNSCAAWEAGITSSTSGSCDDNNPNYAEFPYFTNFNSGLDQYWEKESSASQGRVITTNTYFPYSNKSLLMDVSQNGVWNTNKADLRINLSESNPLIDLRFKFKHFNDEYHQQDGIYFSDDGGVSFQKVYNLYTPNYISNTWYSISIPLEILAQNHGLNPYSEKFIIRFQQRDNYRATVDGFSFDNVEVVAAWLFNGRQQMADAIGLENQEEELDADRNSNDK